MLPEDLLLEILSRLPVKSLKRFKCVSKQWCALIGSQEFIQMHLNRSSLRVLLGLPQSAEDSAGFQERFHLWAAEEFSSLKNFNSTMEEVQDPLQDFPDRKSKKDQRIVVVGSCNGLVCIRYSKFGILVWNPWIRKHWIIPRTRVETELAPGCKRILPYSAFGYGFGYDDVNDDYKVVRIVQLLDISFYPLGCEVKVFSMKSNSWRRIEDFPYIAFRKDFPFGSGVLANGALHWLLSNYKSNPPDSIVAINLTTGEHQLLPAPDLGDYEFINNICVMNGYLCLLMTGMSKMQHYSGMWVMQDYGMKDSWTGLDLDLPEDVAPCNLQPIAYSMCDNNMIFLCNGDEVIWYYDNESVERAIISASPNRVFCDLFCAVASLVEPNCGGKKKIRCSRECLKRKDVAFGMSKMQHYSGMWVMQDYGMKDSWTGLDLDLPEDVAPCNLQPIAYSMCDNNMIFLCNGDEVIWYYDNESVERAIISASPNRVFCDLFCAVASLVEPNCGGKKKIRCSRECLKRKDVAFGRCNSLDNRRPKRRGRLVVSPC